ncbi:hypothetical protein WP50_22625, partial [Lactiplantibacillus plantarum]
DSEESSDSTDSDSDSESDSDSDSITIGDDDIDIADQKAYSTSFTDSSWAKSTFKIDKVTVYKTVCQRSEPAGKRFDRLASQPKPWTHKWWTWCLLVLLTLGYAALINITARDTAMDAALTTTSKSATTNSDDSYSDSDSEESSDSTDSDSDSESDSDSDSITIGDDDIDIADQKAYSTSFTDSSWAKSTFKIDKVTVYKTVCQRSEPAGKRFDRLARQPKPWTHKWWTWCLLVFLTLGYAALINITARDTAMDAALTTTSKSATTNSDDSYSDSCLEYTTDSTRDDSGSRLQSDSDSNTIGDDDIDIADQKAYSTSFTDSSWAKSTCAHGLDFSDAIHSQCAATPRL